jgi:hypothetical protein
MPSGYTTVSASVDIDLDDVFVVRTSTAIGPVGMLSAGSDLANRYEPLTEAWERVPFDTEFKSGGVDLADLFKGQITPTPTETPTPTPTPELTPTPTPASTPPPTPSPQFT